MGDRENGGSYSPFHPFIFSIVSSRSRNDAPDSPPDRDDLMV
jgi:hypothetical protein